MSEKTFHNNHEKQFEIPQPFRNGSGAPDCGPRDILRDFENPDLLTPPETDSGLLSNMKYSFSDAHMVLKPGGWAREITVRELPVSTTMAGVNMSLTPGGVREAHWHQQAEWSIMILGSARITAVDQEGRNFIDDIFPGDIWYFPPGIPHTIQGLEEGCEFLLVFDDGNFSELNTLSLSDWMARTPKEVLSANFGVPRSAFKNLPKGEVYIYQGTLPGPLENQKVHSPHGPVPQSYKFQLLAQKPIVSPGGTFRIADSFNFPVSRTVAAALVEIQPGAMREMHWHPNNDEWQYYLSGEARMTVFKDRAARTFDFRAGDVGYAPFAFGHYIQNVGNETVWFLEMFKSDRLVDISLNQWLAETPPQLVEELLHVGPEFIAALHKEKWPVVKYPASDY